MAYTRIIENLVLTSTLRLEGPAWDNTLVRNVTITGAQGDGIFLRNVSNVRIENVTVTDVKGTGIKLSNSGSTENVQIVGSTIARTGMDGIYAGKATGVEHPGLKIMGNTITDAGLAGLGSGLVHGMYIQSSDFLITGNTVLNSGGGNGISVRSSGTIDGNHIDGALKSGISYYADHPAGAADKLWITENIVANVGHDGARGSINLLGIPSGADPVASIVVSGNVVTGSKGVVIDASYAKAGVSTSSSGNVSVSNAVARNMMEDANLGQQPLPDPVEIETSQTGFDLTAGRSNQSVAQFYADDWTSGTQTVARQKQAAINLNDIDVSITAARGNAVAEVGIDSGRLGVTSSGEAAANGGWISGTETLIFDFSKGAGDVVDVTLDLTGNGTALLTAYRDGIVVGSVKQSGASVTLSDDDGFDKLVLSSDSASRTIAVTGLDATWVDMI